MTSQLLRAKRAADAETVFREGLKRSPKNGRLLFGLIKALNAQGKVEASALVKQEFDEAWKYADVKLRIDDL
jgi:thioredoxin-like negative regulator of GroEL